MNLVDRLNYARSNRHLLSSSEGSLATEVEQYKDSSLIGRGDSWFTKGRLRREALNVWHALQ